MHLLQRAKDWSARAVRFIWVALLKALLAGWPLVGVAALLLLWGGLLGQWSYMLAIVCASVVALVLVLLPQVFPYWRYYFYPPRSVLFVLAAALGVLFLTEQGRDLGTGFLDAEPHQLAFFAVALFYWATANWHGAPPCCMDLAGIQWNQALVEIDRF